MPFPQEDSSRHPTHPASISELGLAAEDAQALAKIASESQGFILITGPNGAGKTRTAEGLLSEVDFQERSWVSIEDPIEVSSHAGKQLEVNEVRGATLELLFLDVVEENPDVFFLGEIQSLVGAWMCTKYANRGHLALSTLPSCNATTALFRLERLGIPRDHIGESLSWVVAQKLFPWLCPECREIKPITDEERDLLAPFTSTPPDQMGHPVGCPACESLGYRGSKPIIEIIEIVPELRKLISEGTPISTIRRHVRRQGVPLLTDGGLRGLREQGFNLKDIYADLFLEELDRDLAPGIVMGSPFPAGAGPGGALETSTVGVEETWKASILVVEDEADTRHLVEQILSSAGYRVTLAEDGAEALLKLATENIDLILSDLYMPNLDGMKLLELVQQHGIEAPVVFLTGAEPEDVEERSYELGAIDFLRKPVDRDVLLESLEIAFAVMNER